MYFTRWFQSFLPQKVWGNDEQLGGHKKTANPVVPAIRFSLPPSIINSYFFWVWEHPKLIKHGSLKVPNHVTSWGNKAPYYRRVMPAFLRGVATLGYLGIPMLWPGENSTIWWWLVSSDMVMACVQEGWGLYTDSHITCSMYGRFM